MSTMPASQILAALAQLRGERGPLRATAANAARTSSSPGVRLAPVRFAGSVAEVDPRPVPMPSDTG